MCGIFGVINTKEKIDKSRVLAARDILAHRGPDDAGVYFSPGNHRSFANAQDGYNSHLVLLKSYLGFKKKYHLK